MADEPSIAGTKKPRSPAQIAAVERLNNSEEHRRHLAELHASNPTNPKWQENNRRHLAELHRSPGWQEKNHRHLTELHRSPGWQEKHRRQLAKLNANPHQPEWSAKGGRIGGRALASRPDAHELAVARGRIGGRALATRPDAHELALARGRIGGRIGGRKNAESGQLTRAREKGWADPEVQALRVRTQNPSPEELALRAFLPPEFEHSGQDAHHRVEGKFPDYQWPARKLIVEMDGHYTHRTLDGFIEREWNRDAVLGLAGWRVLHVVPKELRNPDALHERVRRFIGGEMEPTGWWGYVEPDDLPDDELRAANSNSAEVGA